MLHLKIWATLDINKIVFGLLILTSNPAAKLQDIQLIQLIWGLQLVNPGYDQAASHNHEDNYLNIFKIRQ